MMTLLVTLRCRFDNEAYVHGEKIGPYGSDLWHYVDKILLFFMVSSLFIPVTLTISKPRKQSAAKR